MAAEFEALTICIRMHWTEPLKTAKARAQFWNQPRISIPLMFFCALIFALILSILGSVVIRIGTGSWHGLNPARLFAVVGGILGLMVAFSQRVRIDRQEVELRAEDFSIRGLREHSMSYGELRGYSIIEAHVKTASHRLLMLYPRIGRAFSVGIIPEVTDEQIQSVIGDRVPFVTIFDDLALKVV